MVSGVEVWQAAGISSEEVVRDRFIDVVLGDPEFVEAEFEALVAGWDDRPVAGRFTGPPPADVPVADTPAQAGSRRVPSRQLPVTRRGGSARPPPQSPTAAMR